MSEEVLLNTTCGRPSEPTEDVPTIVVSSASPSSSSSPPSSSLMSTETDRAETGQASDPKPLRIIYPDGRVSEMGEQPISVDEQIRRSERSEKDGRVKSSTPVERADTSGVRQHMSLVDEEEDEEEGGEGDSGDEESDEEDESEEESGEEDEGEEDASQGGEKRKKENRSKGRPIPHVLDPVNPQVKGKVCRYRSIVTPARLGELIDQFEIQRV